MAACCRPRAGTDLQELCRELQAVGEGSQVPRSASSRQ